MRVLGMENEDFAPDRIPASGKTPSRIIMIVIEVKETEEKKWGLYVNGILIGDAKNRFDADHAAVMLKKALAI